MTTTTNNTMLNGRDVDTESGKALSNAIQRYRSSNDGAHLEPNRWWFLSSVFPMIAGTLGPVASAFSICALVQPWRQRLPPGGNIQTASFIPDPAWLTAVNAVQLAVALVANLFLLFNMARRIRFSIAQPITMAGWYISAFTLIILLAVTSGTLTHSMDFPRSELVWSQSFYYAIYAAILYFFVASIMTIIFWGASSGHYSKEFKLTKSQRTLMLQTILLLIYFHLGASVFSTIEHWRYLDGIYWANVSLFTIGFGDFAPSTTLGRALFIPYAIVGIISLGLVVGAVLRLTLEGGSRRIMARMEEKTRRRTVRTVLRTGKEDILQPIFEEPASPSAQPGGPSGKEFRRRKAEFSLMRKIQINTSLRRKWMAMTISTVTWLVLWLVGAYVFMKAEQRYQSWTYFDSFYFCFEAWTTIGYGDLTPISNAGRSFFVFWSLMSLPIITVLISRAGNTVVKFVRNSTLLLGNITILPGDEGFLWNVRYIICKLTFGMVFSNQSQLRSSDSLKHSSSSDRHNGRADSRNEAPQLEGRGDYSVSFINTPDPRSHHIHHIHHTHHGHHVHHHARHLLSTLMSKAQLSSSRSGNVEDELPTGVDFYLLLLREIRSVAVHLRAAKKHRFTFDDWAWYLKLMGEDERDPRNHCKGKVKNRHGVNMHQNENGSHDFRWSWVGDRNPLLGSREESEWILDRLVVRLEELLLAESRSQPAS